MTRILVLFCCYCCCFSPYLAAQHLDIGAFAGALNFESDLNERTFFQNVSPVFGGFVQYQFSPRWSSRIQLLKGSLEADDKQSKLANIRSRNLSAFSDLWQVSLSGQWYFLPFRPHKRQGAVAAYLGAGVAVFSFNPMTKYNNEWIALQPLGTEGQGQAGYKAPYALVQAAIPVQVGFKYAISKHLHLSLECVYHFTFTDYLDDVSGLYVDPAILEQNNTLSPQLANRTPEYTGFPADHLTGTRRGNANNNDTYWTILLRLSVAIYTQPTRKPATPYQWNRWF